MFEVKIIFFSILREKLNLREIFIECGENTSIHGVIEILMRKINFEDYDLSKCMIAVNEDYVDDNYLIKNGDEIAIIPPVSGGSDFL
ncbi:MAG: molybdopterin synthase sulfur carrier subunit [Chloroflexi bacterium]|nr:molybdopterin synthase sulfur carrier subunit [Chloroflexota bacterium]